MAKKIGARETVAREISNETAHDFYSENHRQKSNKALHLQSLGLFFENEIVAAVSFCPPRTNGMKAKYSLELYRLCFKKDVRIIGGASKLIKNFIKTNAPADFFTYQDTTGEDTDVYLNSGMKLVKTNKRKNFLLAPGVSLPDARWGEKEIFTLAEAARRGPDALLGTSIGEVYGKNGVRLTNPQLFTEILGWKEVSVAGDKVYQWVDENLTFYTYRITAKGSDKYYYGVSLVKKANATIEECLKDGYYGSGGVKFKNWAARHDSLEKEVLKTFATKAEAYSEEKRLVGELYKTDPNCLNSTTGGKRQPVRISSVEVRNCLIHGEEKHLGDSCYKCIAANSVSIKNCSIHGDVKHRGDTCSMCSANSATTIKPCPIHGDAKHRGDTCSMCSANSAIFIKNCPTHGKTKHRGDSCSKCDTNSSITIKNCLIHGDTKHRGDTCYKCIVASAISFKICPIHGEARHQGESCMNCLSASNVNTKICPVHGEAKHRGDSCYKCIAAKGHITRTKNLKLLTTTSPEE